MNKFFSKFIPFAFWIFAAPQITLAYGAWNIAEMNSDIQINTDSSVEIKETITADFTQINFDKHGIFRYIPIRYKDKNQQNLSLRFRLESITDETGNPYLYEESNEGDNIMLKIGDPDGYVQGEKMTYIIKYHLDRGLNSFSNYDEFYWNSTGLDWEVPIEKATTIVKLPKTVETNQLKSKCFTGAAYSTMENCAINIIDGQTIQYSSNDKLFSGEGLSIVFGFPKGLVSFPNESTYLLWFLEDNWGYLLPVLTFLLLLAYWYKNGRDPRATRGTIMPEYQAPDDLSPAEIGTLLDDKVDPQDITSTIIDLATRGFIRIHETKEKKFLGENTVYELEKTDAPANANTLKDYEQIIYDNIFSTKNKVKLEDLKYNFYSYIPSIQEKIYKSLVDKKYFAVNPEKTRQLYFGIGGGMIALCFVLFEVFLTIGLSFLIGVILSGLIVAAFGFIMPRKTTKGVDTYIRILGMEEFIKTAERDRLKFYENENIFEKILPYAIALGLADKWARACEGLATQNPSWYSGNISSFNTNLFINHLNSFNNNLSSNLITAPRSAAGGGISGFMSGGGFSGGGFGGGGGGSW